MNKSQYRYVSVSYDTDSNYSPLSTKEFTPEIYRKYTYKCHNDLKPAIGDMFVVITPTNGFSVITITDVHEEDYEFNPKIKYKWLVDKVRLSLYDKIIKSESNIKT